MPQGNVEISLLENNACQTGTVLHYYPKDCSSALNIIWIILKLFYRLFSLLIAASVHMTSRKYVPHSLMVAI